MSKYHQGKYRPRNPKKYVGDVNNIVYRSSWEKKVMIRFDTDPNILRWGSEEVVIPYFSQIDKKMRRYFPDFVIKYRDVNKKIRMALIEVKPYSQTQPPKRPKSGRKTKRFLNEVLTYQKNQDKWHAAELYCNKHNMNFIVLTENEIYKK